MKNKIFPLVDFNSDAKGGTELQRDFLLKYVDNELLSNFEIILSYPPVDFKKNPEKISLLWIHDMVEDPYFKILNETEYLNQFDYLIFVSYTQKEAFRRKFSIPHSKCVVLRNAIEPINPNLKKFDNIEKIKIAYTSTPQRGLIMLPEIFQELKEEFGDNIELNIFSSFSLYGKNHETRNEPFLELFEHLKNTDGINYYGSLQHDELIEKLRDQHIWCLPSIWEETSCISLIEAMSAQCLCVHSDLGALAETSSNFTYIYPHNENLNEHAYIFYEHLRKLLLSFGTGKESIKKHLEIQKYYVDSFYSWKQIRSIQWTSFLNSILPDNEDK